MWIDPRTAELEEWIAAIPTAWDQVVAMRGLCLAFRKLMTCREWQDKIAELEDAMHLTDDEMIDLAIACARAGRRIREEVRGPASPDRHTSRKPRSSRPRSRAAHPRA